MITKSEINKIYSEFEAEKAKPANSRADENEISRLVARYHRPERKPSNLLSKWQARDDGKNKNWKRDQKRALGHPIEYSEMEDRLLQCFSNYTSDGWYFDDDCIRDLAVDLYPQVYPNRDIVFTASRNWIHAFRKRHLPTAKLVKIPKKPMIPDAERLATYQRFVDTNATHSLSQVQN